MEVKPYFKYWGKARKEGEEGKPYHLLPYHCLDVAAVADLEIWWKDEALSLNMVAVPGSWRKKGFLPQAENGLKLLSLTAEEDSWQGKYKDVTMCYSKAYGLEKADSNDKH